MEQKDKDQEEKWELYKEFKKLEDQYEETIHNNEIRIKKKIE